MLSTLLVIGGVLVGLLVLLALIVSLSARPATSPRGSVPARPAAWDDDRRDAWGAPMGAPSDELPAVR